MSVDVLIQTVFIHAHSIEIFVVMLFCEAFFFGERETAVDKSILQFGTGRVYILIAGIVR